MTPRAVPDEPALSVVVPVHDEEDNVAPLIEEIVAALRGKIAFEIVFVDDGSHDATGAKLRHALDYYPELRVLRHAQRSGQSAALRSGVKAARGRWIATLDGDRQNDPADIPKLLAARAAGDAQTGLYIGWRVQRQDSPGKRRAARIANGLRRWWLRDGTPDTGCGLKLFAREAYLDLPWFDHMHRFLPALMKRAGWRTVSVPVNHRARTSGESKYTNLQRAWVGLADLRGVAWLMRRATRSVVEEVRRE